MAIEGISASTVLADKLHFVGMSGREEVSQCFRFQTALASEDPNITPEELLGTAVTITAKSDSNTRHFHGLIDEFAFSEDRAEYHVVLRPWLWFLSKTTDNRIFQNMSTVEIVEEIFGSYPEANFDKRLQGSYEPRDYCVQYGESDLNFVQRLLEDEGIFYFFEHADGAHTLVLTDALSQLAPVTGYDSIVYRPDFGSARVDDESIHRWRRMAQAVSGSFTQTDYDFEKSAADLLVRSDTPFAHELAEGKLYHYPGHYTEISHGETIAEIRLEEVQSPHQRAEAMASTLGPWPGAIFTFENYPRDVENAEYAILAADYDMKDSSYRGGADLDQGFSVRYEMIPTAIPYRPARRTLKPVMKGPQTAVVVGPAGEEIFTDAYSRVKVQFFWDRLGNRDEQTTCFIRVSSVWAGSGWGFIQIPRIGQEVIVDFLEGDPDQPIIVGRVYNDAQMPPYGLPGNATQSGWKSNSSPGGGGWNELRFEDKKGAEEVYFQAEKDHNELVKNNESRNIGNDFAETVGNDAKQDIVNNRDETVGNNKTTQVGVDRTVTIGSNDTESVGVDRSLSVGSNETISVGSNSSETIGANHTQDVGSNQTLSVGVARVRSVGAAETVTVGAAQAITVGAARTVTVGAEQARTIGASETVTVGASQTVSVASDQSVSAGSNRSLSVGSNQTVSVGADESVSVGGNETMSVSGDMALSVGKKLSITAADEISLVCGSAKIIMKKDGTILIDGKDIDVKGSGKIQIKASSDVIIKGSKISQN